MIYPRNISVKAKIQHKIYKASEAPEILSVIRGDVKNAVAATSWPEAATKNAFPEKFVSPKFYDGFVKVMETAQAYLLSDHSNPDGLMLTKPNAWYKPEYEKTDSSDSYILKLFVFENLLIDGKSLTRSGFSGSRAHLREIIFHSNIFNKPDCSLVPETVSCAIFLRKFMLSHTDDFLNIFSVFFEDTIGAYGTLHCPKNDMEVYERYFFALPYVLTETQEILLREFIAEDLKTFIKSQVSSRFLFEFIRGVSSTLHFFAGNSMQPPQNNSGLSAVNYSRFFLTSLCYQNLLLGNIDLEGTSKDFDIYTVSGDASDTLKFQAWASCKETYYDLQHNSTYLVALDLAPETEAVASFFFWVKRLLLTPIFDGEEISLFKTPPNVNWLEPSLLSGLSHVDFEYLKPKKISIPSSSLATSDFFNRNTLRLNITYSYNYFDSRSHAYHKGVLWQPQIDIVAYNTIFALKNLWNLWKNKNSISITSANIHHYEHNDLEIILNSYKKTAYLFPWTLPTHFNTIAAVKTEAHAKIINGWRNLNFKWDDFVFMLQRFF